MPKISELLSQFSYALERVDRGWKDRALKDITADSRKVRKGDLFVAVRGVAQNGEEYIDAAKQAGASAVLTRQGVAPLKGVCHFTTENERQMLARLAAYFYPLQTMPVVAVTGTNGKTSTAELFRQLVELSGKKAASIGTMGLGTDSLKRIDIPALNTSPDPVLLHQSLQRLEQAGAKAVALEASSHGLHQHRLDGVSLKAAAFTNLSRDHLDYHKTEKAYFEAKARLFSYVLPRGERAVLNQDEGYFGELQKICKLRKHQLVTFGTQEQADLGIRKITCLPQGMELRLSLHGQRVEAMLPLIGEFQVGNLLAALGMAEACGIDMQEMVHHLRELKPIRGRMQQAVPGVYIDYAHTPDALQKALQSLRKHCRGRLGVVFGCGGDRDSGKRAPMGKIASEYADYTVVTDDNPRTENAAEIRQQVMSGAGGGKVIEVAERKAAIAAALEWRQPEDMLLIAGKGHETYQIIGEERLKFDDAAVVKSLV